MATKFIAHIREDGTEQTCQEHAFNTAQTAAALLAATGLEKTAYLSGLLHDMGKFHSDFTNYIKAAAAGEEYKGKKVIHTFTGVSFILSNYHNENPFRKLTAETIALAIGSHHGLFDIYHGLNSFNAFRHRLEKQPGYDKTAIDNFFTECATKTDIDNLFADSVKEIQAFAVKLKPLCDKKDKYDFYLGLLSRLILSAVVEGDRRDTASFMSVENRVYIPETDWKNEIISLNTMLDSFPSITDIQKARRAFSDACFDFAEEPGDIYRLDLPTGGGKTLSSLRYALNHAQKHQKRRIFYVAPLLTILEQNAKVIKNALPPDADTLLHYSNIVDEENDGDMLDKRELLQESWESKIVITTLVQMLQTMFSGKMSSVRRFNALSNSVIIFDEIQSLPMRTYSMFNLTVNFLAKCCGATVILCSATLPIFDSVETYKMSISPKQMIPQTLLDSTKKIFKRTDIKKWNDKLKINEVPDIIAGRLETDDSILLVCNKKNQASDIYHALQPELSGKNVELYHLSAGMCPKHRRDTLSALTEALKHNRKVICVSTQVIEAGVDISFDCVLRFAAGMDSVVQSAGRCNRNGKDSNPHDVYILDIEGERLTGLKEIEQGKTAVLELLDCYMRNPQRFDYELSSLQAINTYFENLYKLIDRNIQDFPNPEEENGPTLVSLLSTNSLIATSGIIDTDYMYAQSFATAGKLFTVFDDNQKSIIVPYNKEAENIIASLWSENAKFKLSLRSILQSAKDYTVSIFTPTYESLVKKGAIILSPDLKIPCLLDSYYDTQTGVSSKETICSDTLIL